jgi:hypothetical protein
MNPPRSLHEIQPVLRALAEKASDLRDLDAWVKSLKDKSAGPDSEHLGG